MDTKQLFTYLKDLILQTPAYRGVPSFPDEVERARTLEQIVWWLGATNFSASPHSVAVSELSLLCAQLDSSYNGFMRLLFFLSNVDTPGFFLGHERKHTDYPLPQNIGSHETSRAIAHAVKGEARLRKALAQYLIFEYDLAGYETLTLTELAVRVEKEYRWEYGDKAFTQSSRNVASALARTETERESLRKMLQLALEIGSRHLRSRLAVNWLAQVQLRDSTLQQDLDRLKQMTLKAIWLQQEMTYSTDDPEFIKVLLRGGTFEGQQN
ncbi:hypothetical protein KDA_76460 [Dictyobacter alpinus]|uniref:Uncharacterized protein n=1 Tax=Dictyobacter alpinus TaxID=2014873 RepID=A0A402BLF4_9CHLR|nr:hypothetical protein [Dictyobacter alpinus]GCE32162.1 hypothetical protein KDA_76460 [Dictyobacter alpinus]